MADLTKLRTIVKSSEYKAAQGLALYVDIQPITGLTAASCSAKLGFKQVDGSATGAVTISGGTVTDNTSTWRVSIDISLTALNSLPVGVYELSIELTSSSPSATITVWFTPDIKSRVKVINKRTT